MADTFVKKPMVVVGTKDQVVAEMGTNDFGIATDVSFYTAEETDVKLADKQDKGDYATNTALSQGLAQKQDIATAVNYDNITNCLTEIPQDIKLELNNGTLTLKAGSKVYVPNGSGVFDAVTTTADMSTTRTDSQVCMVWRYPSGALGIFPIQLFYSGATAPTQYQFMFWYDTTNNLCKYTSNSGSTWAANLSFPICVVETDGTKISAIKQVFNGFGYVGATVFALPGVKGLVPNGRNTDGTLKSNVLNITSVKTYTVHGASIKEIRIASSGLYGYLGYIVSDTKPSGNFNLWYNPVENIMYDTGGSGTPSVLNATVGISVEFDGTRITSFTAKTAFHAVDYNEFNEHRIVDFQEPTANNNYTWYRKYSDGWVEQGGYTKETSITLPVEMALASQYTALVQYNPVDGDISNGAITIENKTTTGFDVQRYSSGTDEFSWQVSGMSAQ